MSEQWMDLHKFDNPPAVVGKAPALSGSLNTKTNVLAWFNWVKVEIPESIEVQEARVKKIVVENMISKWKDVSEPFPCKFITKWVFAFRWNYKDIEFFTNEKGETIIAPNNLRKSPFFEKWDIFKLTWYSEKFEDWEHKLYKNGSDKPINPNSLEYLQAYQEMDFIDDMLMIQISIKEKEKLPFDRKSIIKYVGRWVLKFEDLEQLKMEKEWDFEFWVDLIKQSLLKQCQDKRLIDYWAWIKEKYLIIYFRKKYINGNLMNQCANVLPPEMRLKESDIQDLFKQKYITFKEASQLVNTLPDERRDLSGK